MIKVWEPIKLIRQALFSFTHQQQIRNNATVPVYFIFVSRLPGYLHVSVFNLILFMSFCSCFACTLFSVSGNIQASTMFFFVTPAVRVSGPLSMSKVKLMLKWLICRVVLYDWCSSISRRHFKHFTLVGACLVFDVPLSPCCLLLFCSLFSVYLL